MKVACICILAVCVLPLPIWAASFDCAKATTNLEKMVCADPTLSKLDETLNDAYGRAMKSLSANGQRQLREGQRSWLRFMRQICFTPGDDRAGSECVKQEYESREKDLSVAAHPLGPYVFTRLDSYQVSGIAQIDSRVIEQRYAIPQIDNPLNGTTQAWNKTIAEAIGKLHEGGSEGGECDEGVSFETTYASARLISLTVDDWEYCHGTPHGHGGTTGYTYVLPDMRKLRIEDIFAPDKPWKQFLTERCFQVFKAKAPDVDIDMKNVQDIAMDPAYWSIKSDGLTIRFDVYSVLAYVDGYTEVSIPWTDLKPFMALSALITASSP